MRPEKKKRKKGHHVGTRFCPVFHPRDHPDRISNSGPRGQTAEERKRKRKKEDTLSPVTFFDLCPVGALLAGFLHKQRAGVTRKKKRRRGKGGETGFNIFGRDNAASFWRSSEVQPARQRRREREEGRRRRREGTATLTRRCSLPSISGPAADLGIGCHRKGRSALTFSLLLRSRAEDARKKERHSSRSRKRICSRRTSRRSTRRTSSRSARENLADQTFKPDQPRGGPGDTRVRGKPCLSRSTPRMPESPRRLGRPRK